MAITLDGTSGVTYPSGATSNPSSGSVLVGTTDTLTLTNKTLTSPTLSSATLASPAVAGQLEFNSGVPYFTPSGTQRGVIPGMQYYALNSSVVGANATGAQNLFGVGVTLSSSTVYCFEIEFTITRSAGTTSHTLAYGYGGTSTFNNVYIITRRAGFNGSTFPVTGTGSTTVVVQSNNSTASTVMTGPITNASYSDTVLVKGTLSINAGGTFIPQYTLSATPGGAYTTNIGSYILIYPIGASGSNISVGTWA